MTKFRIVPSTIGASTYWTLERRRGFWPFYFWTYETTSESKAPLIAVAKHLEEAPIYS